MKLAKRERGAAILVAMLVVTLVATLAAGLQWRQWRMLAQESAARTQSQAAWVLVGALDWARLILREDARATEGKTPMDHLAEPWALPLQEAKLSSFLAADALAEPAQDNAYLSGRITDAQAKINLTNLIDNNQLSVANLAALHRLYEQLQLPMNELKIWTERWLESQPGAAAQANKTRPLRPQLVEQLAWLGVSGSSLAVLKDYLTILPRRTPVNLNTASSLVIVASVPGIDLSAAQKLVQLRAQAPFKSIADVQSVLGLTSALDGTNVSVTTQYFEVRGQLRLGDWVMQEISLVERRGMDVVTIWRRKV
ncbi:MAG: type II secretion system minor pseudopilin GspK [Cytophagales bacterium]|nr:type II secretion system minor pseudopilin GspK [Cytophagales bacterium]